MEKNVSGTITLTEDIVDLGTELSATPWSSKNESLFIQLMDDEVKSMHSRQTGTFTKQAWARLRDEIVSRTGYKYTQDQLRNKYNQLRILFNKFNALKSQTGVGWDNTLLTIPAPNKVWERLFKVNSHARRFKKKGRPHYHALSRIFRDTSATGNLVHPSNKSPSSTNSFYPDFMSQSKPEEVEVDSSPCTEGKKGKGKGKAKSKGGSSTTGKSRKRDSFATNISDALNEFNATGKRKLEIMETKLLTQQSAATTFTVSCSASAAASVEPRGRL